MGLAYTASAGQVAHPVTAANARSIALVLGGSEAKRSEIDGFSFMDKACVTESSCFQLH